MPEHHYRSILWPRPLEWLGLLFPSLLIWGVLSAAGLSADAWRLALLFLPGSILAWLAITRRTRIWQVLSHLWAFMFGADAALRAFIWFTYRSDLDSAFIFEALVNTTLAESGEYLSVHWPMLLGTLAGFSLLNLWLLGASRFIRGSTVILAPRQIAVLILLTLVLALTYGLRPNRAQHPLLYWTGYLNKLETYRDRLSQNTQLIEDWETGIGDDEIRYDGPPKQVFVLVLAESISRHNLQLCGYDRPTTPNLNQLREELTVFCSAYSPASSTIGALRLKLTDASLTRPLAERDGSLLARARAAGFKVFWISNQDDEYTASLYGQYADQAVFTNRRSGRSSQSLDAALLSPYQRALDDPHPRKLLVVHMIGAHPNYALRYPAEFAQFNNLTHDTVSQSLQHAGRNLLTRRSRNHYDNAILYHDHVVAELITRLKSSDPDKQKKTLLYAADHGNDVGHTSNRVGHSPHTEAGYAVPVIFWQAGQPRISRLEQHPILTDSLDTNALLLMGVRWTDADWRQSWFSADYAWEPPPDWPPWKIVRAP